MQLSRAQKQSDRNTTQYKQEIQRQNVVIQKLHMYLATTGSEEDIIAEGGMITEGGESMVNGGEIVGEGGGVIVGERGGESILTEGEQEEREGTMENSSDNGGSLVNGVTEDKPPSIIDTSDYHNHMQKLQVGNQLR